MRSGYSKTVRIVKSVLILAAVLVAIGIVLLTAKIREKSSAQALLGEVQALTLRKSTTSDVEAIVHKYGGRLAPSLIVPPGPSSICLSADAAYEVRIANDVINYVGRSFSFLRPVGFRPYGIEVTFLLTKGRLCSMSYSFATMQDQRQELFVETSLRLRRGPGTSVPVAAYDASGSGFINDTFFRVMITPEASTEQRDRAFGFDLSCITRLSGCKSQGEILPGAWKDYELLAEKRGWLSPPPQGEKHN